MSNIHKVRKLRNISIFKCWDISVKQKMINGHKIVDPASGHFTKSVHLSTQMEFTQKILYERVILQMRLPLCPSVWLVLLSCILYIWKHFEMFHGL